MLQRFVFVPAGVQLAEFLTSPLDGRRQHSFPVDGLTVIDFHPLGYVAPSPLEPNRIWAGTDDGLIYLTTDGGKNWNNVTPPSISPWQKISLIDAGHFDANAAYAAINTLRIDDLRPHIFKTNDSGKTWTEIANGIPVGQIVNAVREDPVRKGLLFAAAE